MGSCRWESLITLSLMGPSGPDGPPSREYLKCAMCASSEEDRWSPQQLFIIQRAECVEAACSCPYLFTAGSTQPPCVFDQRLYTQSCCRLCVCLCNKGSKGAAHSRPAWVSFNMQKCKFIAVNSLCWTKAPSWVLQPLPKMQLSRFPCQQDASWTSLQISMSGNLSHMPRMNWWAFGVDLDPVLPPWSQLCSIRLLAHNF